MKSDTVLRMNTEAFVKIFPVEKERELIVEAIEFYINYLGLDGHAKNITFLPAKFRKGEATGSCDRDSNLPNSYLVEFTGCAFNHGRNIASVLTTIAHELIHVKQFVFDGLEEAYKLNHKAPTKNRVPYSSTWWEKEAYGRQEELVMAFIESIK